MSLPREPQVDAGGPPLPTAEALALQEEEKRRQKQESDEAWEKHVREWKEKNRREAKIKQKKGRQEILENLELRRAFFSRIPLEGLSPRYREANEKLFMTFDRIEEQVRALENEELEEDAQRTLRRETFRSIKEARRLMKNQRKVLLNDYAQFDLGVEDPRQIQDFISFVETVEKRTFMGGAVSASISQRTKDRIKELTESGK